MYKTMCHPYVHTGHPGSHRYSPGSHSFRPSLVICTPQQSPLDQGMLTLFLSIVPPPFPHTQAPIPSASGALACGEQLEEKAGLLGWDTKCKEALL